MEMWRRKRRIGIGALDMLRKSIREETLVSRKGKAWSREARAALMMMRQVIGGEIMKMRMWRWTRRVGIGALIPSTGNKGVRVCQLALLVIIISLFCIYVVNRLFLTSYGALSLLLLDGQRPAIYPHYPAPAHYPAQTALLTARVSPLPHHPPVDHLDVRPIVTCLRSHACACDIRPSTLPCGFMFQQPRFNHVFSTLQYITVRCKYSFALGGLRRLAVVGALSGRQRAYLLSGSISAPLLPSAVRP